MTPRARAVLLVAALAVIAGGCSEGYYDDDSYYGHAYYRGDRVGTDRDRVRVCDSDGDDCHWEYRQ